MNICTTNRILLRTWEVENAKEAFSFYGAPEVSRLIGDGKPVQTVKTCFKIYGLGQYAA